MTQAIASPAVHDLIGIGFGPSNLALAIALQEREKAQGKLDALFLDKQADYRWHGNTLVTQSELQISFLKDLVTLRNPTSPYSFVNYLKAHDRLVDFINLGTFYPCRMEYNDYLRWVAGQFQAQARYGEEVLAIEPILHQHHVEALRVISRDALGEQHVRTTRSVVVSAGGTPRVPPAFKALKDDGRVFHHSQYLARMAQQPCVEGKAMRIAIIGGGQSAAEAFIDLNDSFASVQVDMILRGSALKPADDSPFVNEVFSPAFTDLVFQQVGAERERLVAEYQNTNYSVVDLDLIERIYGILPPESLRRCPPGFPHHDRGRKSQRRAAGHRVDAAQQRQWRNQPQPLRRSDPGHRLRAPDAPRTAGAAASLHGRLRGGPRLSHRHGRALQGGDLYPGFQSGQPWFE